MPGLFKELQRGWSAAGTKMEGKSGRPSGGGKALLVTTGNWLLLPVNRGFGAAQGLVPDVLEPLWLWVGC